MYFFLSNKQNHVKLKTEICYCRFLILCEYLMHVPQFQIILVRFCSRTGKSSYLLTFSLKVSLSLCPSMLCGVTSNVKYVCNQKWKCQRRNFTIPRFFILKLLFVWWNFEGSFFSIQNLAVSVHWYPAILTNHRFWSIAIKFVSLINMFG